MNPGQEQIVNELYTKVRPYLHTFLEKTRLFRNKDIALQLEFPRKTISREKIINYINYVHFSDEKVFLHLCDPREDADYLVEASPEAASSETITCHLPFSYPQVEMNSYEIRHVLVRRENAIIAVPAILKKVHADGISIMLSADGIPLGQRKMQRFYCSGITVEISQGQSALKGELKDFNACSFRIKVSSYSRTDAAKIDFDRDAQLTIQRNSVVYFSGMCRAERIYLTRGEWGIVFRQIDLSEALPRVVDKIRNPRLKLTPQPVACIKHPFLKNKIEREIIDLSNRGMLIREDKGKSVMVPGLIIPELIIRYAGVLEIACQARVLYRREEDEHFLFGIAIVDMSVQNHTLLTSLTFNHVDPNAFISKRVDLDALWEFFFDTGFIYPKKYHLIGAAADDFKRTYKHLYEDCPEIARHFTYEKNGRIYGHISMIKAYSRTWLFHHLAARPMEGKIVGLQSLKQVIHYLDDFQELPSMRADYVLAFYQPQNRFAEKAYGGFTAFMNNRHASSQDLFAYATCPVEKRKEFHKGYSLGVCENGDLRKLEQFYGDASGGLLLKAMGVTAQGSMIDSTLQGLYVRSGLQRSCRIFALKFGEELLAILIHEQSDTGLNLSEMLNSIKIFILNSDTSWDAISQSISYLAEGMNRSEVAVFLYPDTYAQSIPVKNKTYQFWILNLRDHFGNDYKNYMAKNFRIRF